MHNRNRKACAYCGRQTNLSTDECENCGSTTFESLEQAELHTEQHRQFNQTHPPKQPAQTSRAEQTKQPLHNKMKKIVSLAVSVVVTIIIAVIVLQRFDFFSNISGNPKTTTHNINNTIQTDWFKMTVYEGKIIRTKNSYCGLQAPASGYERVLVDINLNNYLSDENLDINIAEDFYLETNSVKYPSLNTGGSYSIFDKLFVDGMFFGKFMVSPKTQLHGYIAFDIPANIKKLSFVYEEYNFEGDDRTTVKHYYKVDLEYEMPEIPSTQMQAFYNNAYEAGYVLEVSNDYDGFDTFWVGAHKYIDESSKGITTKPEPVYWIDCTRDASEANAKVEYNRFVNKVKSIGGTASADSGTASGVSYQYQSNVSSAKYGIAYQIGLHNYLVESAPIEYMNEIVTFFDSLSLKIG